MKRTKIILPLFCLVFLSASCSIFRSVPTAKVGHIDPEIIQMPTVTELDVSETALAADTVITRNFFKKDIGYSTKKQVTNALVASMLKKSGSDMLMEPMVNSVVTYNGFNSTLKLSVKGFPAKYSGFRTITMSDVETLKELEGKQQVGSISLSRFLRCDAGRAYQAATDLTAMVEPAKVAKPRWRRPLGYKGLYEFSVGFAAVDSGRYSNDEYPMDDKAFSLTTTQGSQIKNWLYLGVGAGLSYGVYTTEADWHYWAIPIFGHMRIHFWDRKVAPYFDLRPGVTALFNHDREIGGEEKTYFDAFYPNVDFGLGLSFGKFSIGANADIGIEDGEDIAWSYIKVKIGLAF